ncbi:MAG: cytochrome c3 family protein, partial [Rubrivivax sp.]|nr:cytochrome c3 family protein [Rubrivivax sp.]
VSTWKPTKFNHTQVPVTAQCASCHTGSYPPADGRNASHTPYQLVATLASANCDTCHKSGTTLWTPARLHQNTTVLAQCAICHASNKPNNTTHVGQTVCETCHKSTSTWTGARVDHNSFTVATVCSSCHNGSGATGKNATHIPSGATNCISCHNVSTWKPTKFNHTQVPVTAQCASCHNGSYPPADGKNAAHVPYQLVATAAAANCDSCHKGGYASWANGRLHANVSVTGQCKTCHNGSYTSQGADAKPANHIPETQLLNGGAMECNACHTSTTSWTQRMNHNNSLGGGAGWCKACHASGTAFLGSMEKKSLTHEKKTPPAIDCSESGCHRPLGNKGVTFSKWD